MLELYNFPLSTCSIKVRLALAEKGVEAQVHWLNLGKGEQFDPNYLKLNPQAVVPTLIDDGFVVTESTLINEYLESRFPEPRLVPEAPSESYRMRRFTHMLDTVLHPACIVVTSAVIGRAQQLRQPEDEVRSFLGRIPDLAKREMRVKIFEQGVESSLFRPALEAYIRCLDEVEGALSHGMWLAGDQISLADLGVVPYVMRLDHVGLPGLWSAEQRPRLGDWYRRMQERESYRSAVVPHLTEPILQALARAGHAVQEHLLGTAGLPRG